MDAKKCDRCGAFYERTQDTDIYCEHKIRLYGGVPYHPLPEYPFKDTYEFCPDCWKEFCEFLGVKIDDERPKTLLGWMAEARRAW